MRAQLDGNKEEHGWGEGTGLDPDVKKDGTEAKKDTGPRCPLQRLLASATALFAQKSP